MKNPIIYIVMVIIILAASTGNAVLITGDTANSSNAPDEIGNFTGSFNYSYTDSTTAQITLELTNTSSTANGGYLTALAFNNPFDQISGVTLSGDTTGNFDLLSGTDLDDSISASPWGDFDIGAASTNSWLGGGKPSGGIGVTETETFIFDLTGTGLDTLSTQDFIDELSNNSSGDSYWFAARFRGFEDGGSDKIPALAMADEVITTPEPATLLMLGTGIAGYMCTRRRKK